MIGKGRTDDVSVRNDSERCDRPLFGCLFEKGYGAFLDPDDRLDSLPWVEGGVF